VILKIEPGESILVEMWLEGAEEPCLLKLSAWRADEGMSGVYVMAYAADDDGKAGTVWERTSAPETDE
jgi:hypothetical protein